MYIDTLRRSSFVMYIYIAREKPTFILHFLTDNKVAQGLTADVHSGIAQANFEKHNEASSHRYSFDAPNG